MARKKYKLDVEKCLIIGDARRLEAGMEAVKSLRQLSHLLFKRKFSIKYDKEGTIYSRIYRYQNDGFYNENTEIIKAICEILRVDREELVKEF